MPQPRGGGLDLRALAVDGDVTGLGLVRAVDQAGELGAAGAEQPREADDLAAPEPQVELARSGRSFLKGLLTNLANPKAIIYFGSVFSLFVGDNVGTGERWGIFLLIVLETLAWFTVVASLFALPAMRRGYQRMAKWIDGIAGTLFAGFGIHLIISR